jgi:DNA-binding LacI/PurR family transcriptional regulator
MQTAVFETKKAVASPVRDRVKKRIRAQAERLGPGGKLPKVVELCECLDVAGATVNVALEELEVEGVIRRRRGSGIYVAPHIGRKTVGLMIPVRDMNPSCFSGILVDACRRRADRQSERFLTYIQHLHGAAADDPDGHWALLEDVRRGRLNGLLAVGLLTGDELESLRVNDVQTVMMADESVEGVCGTVNIDVGAMVHMGVEALAARGRRRIALITPHGFRRSPHHPWVKARGQWQEDLDAWQVAMGKQGLEPRPEWTWEYVPTPDDLSGRVSFFTNEAQGHRAFKALWEQTERPDGLVILDDMMTRGALAAARQAGIKVGRDVAIATHANCGSPALLGEETRLMRMEVDAGEIVDAMFGMLEAAWAGKARRAHHRAVPRLCVEDK